MGMNRKPPKTTKPPKRPKTPLSAHTGERIDDGKQKGMYFRDARSPAAQNALAASGASRAERRRVWGQLFIPDRHS